MAQKKDEIGNYVSAIGKMVYRIGKTMILLSQIKKTGSGRNKSYP